MKTIKKRISELERRAGIREIETFIVSWDNTDCKGRYDKSLCPAYEKALKEAETHGVGFLPCPCDDYSRARVT